ncbi:MAG TPA: hypothetical protein VNQ73_11090 [Ilumatobacter sp.]|nr:hypothetical protein [Ilumatobacter sp.]
MSWNPPTAQLPPPAAHSAPTPPETPAERRARSAASAAAWVGLLGAALVLTAAAVVLTNGWPGSGKLIRAAALTLGAAGATAIAERFRRSVPVTAAIDAHLGAFLVAAAGIAGGSLLGYEWPVCLAVGGLAAIAATEYQSRRWRPDTMLAGQVVAVCLAATGGGALTPATAALLVVLAAVVFELLGAHRRATIVAGIAVLSPLAWVCGAAGLGRGTLTRAGVIGDRLDWSRPVVGLVAGAVFAAVAYRTANKNLYLAAVGAPTWSGLDSVYDFVNWLGRFLDRYDVTAIDRWCAVFSLIALATGLIARRVGTPSSWLAYSPALTMSGLWLVLTVAGRNPGWAIPLALTVGIVAAGLGAWFRLGAPLVGGTTIVGLTLLVASWSSLSGTPTWVWLAVGGAALLGVAVVIERGGMPDTVDLKTLTDRWN